MVSLRLAYQDLEVQQKKKDQAMSRMDPKKAQQMERLGMGFGSGAAPRATGFNSTKSHSLMSDSGVIVQEEPGSARTAQFTSNTKDNFFDDFEVLTCTVLTSQGGALLWSRDSVFLCHKDPVSGRDQNGPWQWGHFICLDLGCCGIVRCPPIRSQHLERSGPMGELH